MSKNRFKITALNLIDLLDKGKIMPESLTPHQRKVIVKYYMESMSYVPNTFIADSIGVSDVHVARLKREMLKKSVWEIETIDIKMLAAALKKKKEEYQREAAKKGEYALAWKIECEYIEKMQELGFVYKAPQKHQFIPTELEEFRERMTEFYVEFGVPTPMQFVAQLKQIRGDDGRNRKLLEGPDRKPSAPDNRD